MRLHYVAGGLALILLISAAIATTTLDVPSAGTVLSSSAKWFDYVVVIMLENHSINYTYFNGIGTNPCLGNCTYYTSLANSNGLAESYVNTGINGSSIGDYIAITSGYGNTSSMCNNGPGVSGCPLIDVPNIVDSLEATQLTWKAYVEGYPISPGCYNNFKGFPYYYDPNHNPFIYYSDIQGNATRCSHIVRANSVNPQPNVSLPRCWPIAVDNDDLFLNDLGSVATASNYMFLAPDAIDDNHDCNDVSVGNAWLQQLVPQILNSYLFRTQRAALFITFDEPYCTFTPCPSPTSINIYTVWASNSTSLFPTTRAGFKSSQAFTHYSQLKTVEDNWLLPYLTASTDGSSSTKNMQGFFR